MKGLVGKLAIGSLLVGSLYSCTREASFNNQTNSQTQRYDSPKSFETSKLNKRKENSERGHLEPKQLLDIGNLYKRYKTEKLDDSTEKLLLSVTDLTLTVDGGLDNVLEKFMYVGESYWENVRTLAIGGKLKRDVAIESLRRCLYSVIPEYRKNSHVEISPGNYWAGRLALAEIALRDIDDPSVKIVSFRGIPLSKK